MVIINILSYMTCASGVPFLSPESDCIAAKSFRDLTMVEHGFCSGKRGECSRITDALLSSSAQQLKAPGISLLTEVLAPHARIPR